MSFGFFEFEHKTFGLLYAAQTIQQFMNVILVGQNCVFAYLDDIRVATSIVEDCMYTRLRYWKKTESIMQMRVGCSKINDVEHMRETEKVESIIEFPAPIWNANNPWTLLVIYQEQTNISRCNFTWIPENRCTSPTRIECFEWRSRRRSSPSWTEYSSTSLGHFSSPLPLSTQCGWPAAFPFHRPLTADFQRSLYLGWYIPNVRVCQIIFHILFLVGKANTVDDALSWLKV